MLKLLRIMHWRILARGALTIPVFLTLLIVARRAKRCASGWASR